MRKRILATLLIASFGAMAATVSAQTPSAPNNSPRNAPVGSVTAPATDGTADPTSGARMPSSDSGMAAPVNAQGTSSAPNNSPRNAPVGSMVAPKTDGSADPSYGARTPPANSMNNSGMPTSMTGYKSARAACDQQPVGSRDQCRSGLNTRYSGVAPKCQKLQGSALDECLKGADTGQ